MRTPERLRAEMERIKVQLTNTHNDGNEINRLQYWFQALTWCMQNDEQEMA